MQKRRQENPALVQSATKEFKFRQWQRAVKYKYGLHPLSVVGSLADPGGRFNVGEINAQLYPMFPALYLACDKDTALQEILGQENSGNLTAQEIALTKPQSTTIVSVSGQLSTVVDIRNETALERIVSLIKDFKVDPSLTKRARELEWDEPGTVKSAQGLHQALLDPEWRSAPTHFDIPATPQIFGQLVFSAGIEGILYPSKLSGKDCLAIFTRNLEEDSYVEMEDTPLHRSLPKKIDNVNWKFTEMSVEELDSFRC